jgi:hypothetical protein
MARQPREAALSTRRALFHPTPSEKTSDRSRLSRLPPGGDRDPSAARAGHCYREKADLDAFQINFHGNRNLDQLLQSMECFMQDVAPVVSGHELGSKN